MTRVPVTYERTWHLAWIVTFGERGEGSLVQSVHATRESGLEGVRKCIDRNPGTWKGDEHDRWSCGPDQIELVGWEIEP